MTATRFPAVPVAELRRVAKQKVIVNRHYFSKARYPALSRKR
jgi:hypothetical protein